MFSNDRQRSLVKYAECYEVIT
uniref:Transposase n=1 Tax=Heterorhabditis bacteriophora TaxID=37862 RepID=A0A1I7WC71_HETBA